jgi:hypothetical protein
MALEAKLVDVGQEMDELGVPLDMFYWDRPNYIAQHSYGSMLGVKYLEEVVLEKCLADIMARTPNSESPCTDFLITWAKDALMQAKRQVAFIQERKDVKKFVTFMMLFDMKDPHTSFDSCKKQQLRNTSVPWLIMKNELSLSSGTNGLMTVRTWHLNCHQEA